MKQNLVFRVFFKLTLTKRYLLRVFALKSTLTVYNTFWLLNVVDSVATLTFPNQRIPSFWNTRRSDLFVLNRTSYWHIAVVLNEASTSSSPLEVRYEHEKTPSFSLRKLQIVSRHDAKALWCDGKRRTTCDRKRSAAGTASRLSSPLVLCDGRVFCKQRRCVNSFVLRCIYKPMLPDLLCNTPCVFLMCTQKSVL